MSEGKPVTPIWLPFLALAFLLLAGCDQHHYLVAVSAEGWCEMYRDDKPVGARAPRSPGRVAEWYDNE